jgi:hypothetical protein
MKIDVGCSHSGLLPSRLAWRSWQQCVMLRIAMVPTIKKQVSMAVRQRDMHVAQTDALQQSILARYLPMLGPDVTAVPNTTNTMHAALPGWHWAYSPG